MEPAALRAEMPALERTIYMNTGASGPSPRRVVDAVTEFVEYHEYEAPANEGMYTAAFEAFADAREAAAGLLGATPAEVALTQSTVDGINRVANAIDWSAGDTVLRTDLEHPAGVLPWQRQRDMYGVEVEVLETDRGRLDVDDVKDAVHDARLVCLSSLSWNYGTRLPVSEVVDVAHDAGAQVLVDAVQSPGQTAVDVSEWGADFVACASHKWLLGPWGAGMLYVSEDVVTDLEPDHVGYLSVTDSNGDYEFKPNAHRFEMGTTAPAPYVGLRAAIETIDAVGIGTIESHIQELTDRLKAGLGDRLLGPEAYESGLVTFAVDDPEATVERLAEAGIQIRAIPSPEAVRASLHVFNTAGDVDALLDAL